MTKYYEALARCAVRYDTMLTNSVRDDEYWGAPPSVTEAKIELLNFISQLKAGIGDQLPLEKLNRWLGYIQGRLIAFGITDVTTERNWTRPLFRSLDYAD